MKRRLFITLILAMTSIVVVNYYKQNGYTYKYTPAQPWMEAQVQHDLQKFKRGIDINKFELVKNLIDEGKLPNLYIISIKGNQVERYPKKLTKRSKMIVHYLEDMLRAGIKLPQVKLLLGDRDAWDALSQVPENSIKELPPVFVFAASRKSKFRDHYILFPDDHTLGSHLMGYRKGWRKIYNEIMSYKELYPWEEKQDIAYWRGLPTDVEHYEEGKSPRILLTKLSETHPEHIDAAFTETKFANALIIKTLRPLMQILSIPPYVSYEEQLQYKILLNLDGYTCTYPGFLWRMLSGSVVVKQETDNEQWFYGISKPWEHYIPVKQNLEDMIEKVEWIKEHDKEAKQIAENAFNLVEQSLKPEHIDAYIVYLLEEYSKLLN